MACLLRILKLLDVGWANPAPLLITGKEGGEGGDREIRSSSPSKPQSADPVVVPPPPDPTSYSSINLQDEGRGRRPHAEYMGRNGG